MLCCLFCLGHLILTIAELVWRGAGTAEPEAAEDPPCGLEKASSRLVCAGLCVNVERGGEGCSCFSAGPL